MSRLGINVQPERWNHPVADLFSQHGWTTGDEIEFLKGLGSHSGRDSRVVKDRLELLQSYRRSLDLRSRWGQLDQAKVREAVNQMIAEERHRRPA